MHQFLIKPLAVLGLLAFACLTTPIAKAEGHAHNASAQWEVLFDGTSTDAFRGWKSDTFPEKGWVIEDQALHIQANSKAGDIVTKKKYASFDLRFQWKVSKGANSGVIYRCIEHEDVRLSFMSGPEYQILEDDNHVNGKNPKTTAASLYAHYAPNDKKKLKPVGEWNTGRVVVHGSKVEHWLNGQIVVAYDLDSEAFKEISAKTHYRQWPKFAKEKTGHIAFQDHNNDVWFRNIKIKELADEEPDPAVDADGFQVLFDGSSLEHFRGLNRIGFPDTNWSVDQSAIYHNEKWGGGDIITRQAYASFDLRFQWKISEGGNSGVKYFVGENGDPKNIYALGPEYQVIDDDKHKDAKDPRRQAGALYALYPCNDQKKLKPVGEWNTARIVVNGNNVEHWLNGAVALSYELWSDDFTERVGKSKYRSRAEFAKVVPGHIAFQDHGDKVWYRGIRIRDLSKPSAE